MSNPTVFKSFPDEIELPGGQKVTLSAQGITDELFTKAIAFFLGKAETSGFEITGVGLFLPEGGGKGANTFNAIFRFKSPGLPALEAFIIPEDNDVTLRARLVTHTPIASGYAEMQVGGVKKRVLVARPGRTMTLQGKMSTFGGPNDKGMTETEGLAIVRDADIGTVPGIADLFPPGTTKALGRKLLHDTKAYIACRWDYRTTPRKHLIATNVIVKNPANGKMIKARPVDWGPAEWTNRVADLSNFAAAQLDLKTDDVCEIIIPLPAGAKGPALPKPTGNALRDQVVTVAQRQYQTYHGIPESRNPMAARIKGYWDELKKTTGRNEFNFQNTEVAWSAVFVSWCLMQGGVVDGEFGFSPAHSRFVHASIARFTNDPNGKYTARPWNGHEPEPGDIIHHNREDGTKTYEDAKNDPKYESHSAIVVAKGEDTRGRYVITVGGNESQTVGNHRHALDENGKLIQRSKFKYISVIKLV